MKKKAAGALGYAILSLLSRESLTGYDVAGRMRARVSFFWEARHGQIYPELARLEERGLVFHQLVEQSERPDKKVYEITSAGLSTLKDWLTEPPTPRAVRDELVLKAYSVWLAEPEKALTLFRNEQHRHEERLLEYEQIETWMQEEWGEDLRRVGSPSFASYAALRRGILNERGYIEWCRWIADSLEHDMGREDAGADR
jgi:DNA-binding PadR family transcriptional regulator